MIRKFLLLIVTFVITFSLGTFGSTLVRAFFYSPDTEIEVPIENQTDQEAALLPVRLIIPSLSIDTKVQHVGVNQKGNMATPNNFTDVGWYKYGATPGARGSAVIAGHVNNGLGLSGVFENLSAVKPGDTIIVERADGSRVTFEITGSRTYPYNDAPEEIIFNPSGSVRLNIITCEGKWVKEDKTYDKRLVVFAKLAGE